MSLWKQMLIILLSFILSFAYIRSFLAGLKRYQLNNSAYKKRKKGESFKEWVFYSRYKKEIPKFLLMFYYCVLVIHCACLVICIFFHNFTKFASIGRLLSILIACFDSVWMLIIAVLFWSSGHSYAYGRWITKSHGRKK